MLPNIYNYSLRLSCRSKPLCGPWVAVETWVAAWVRATRCNKSNTWSIHIYTHTSIATRRTRILSLQLFWRYVLDRNNRGIEWRCIISWNGASPRGAGELTHSSAWRRTVHRMMCMDRWTKAAQPRWLSHRVQRSTDLITGEQGARQLRMRKQRIEH